MNKMKKAADPMQKRIPRNPKYNNMEPTIDTGASVTRYMRKLEEIRQNYRIRSDEIFKRMKVTTFVQLVLQVAEINHIYEKSADELDENDENDDAESHQSDDNELQKLADEVNGRNHYRSDGDEGRASQPPLSQRSQRSTFQSVISGVGELDSTNLESANESANPFPDNLPYLMLDVRDKMEFDLCHIIKARNYPAAMISRSVNFETKEMLACRNQPGKIILIYDDDERIAPRVATTLVERGYDNLFMLSGGLKVASKLFPEGLITGVLPEALRPPKKPTNRSSRGSLTSSSFGSTPAGARDTPLMPETPVSVRSGVSGSTVVAAVRPVLQEEFTIQDLAKLSIALDDVADDKSTTSSRYSASRSGTTTTTRTSAASSVTSSKLDRKPFKP